MRITLEQDGEPYSATSIAIGSEDAAALKSARARAIIERLAKRPMFPKELAVELDTHEQGIYYHLRNLEAAGIIRVESVQKKRGLEAQRYELAADAVSVMLRPPKKSSGRAPRSSPWLEPFVSEGRINARIIVGSPDPHGPHSARSRDGYYGMELALFLGTYATVVPQGRVLLDTESRDLEGDLIVIGGPIVNSVAARLNEHAPIRFDDKRVVSTISGREYLEETTGVITRFENPHGGSVLWIYGLRNAGTRAAMNAFTQSYAQLTSGNSVDGSANRVVLGLDRDSDGIVDDVEFAE